jgi:Ras-related protein Rab-2A
MSYRYLLKYIIVGETGCGKSCILNQFVEKRFNHIHDITIGVEFGSSIITSRDNKKIKLQIWDTAGQEMFRSITRAYYRGTAVAIVVFDTTRIDTFNNLKKWFDEISHICDKRAVIVLVGNKHDLTYKRQVTEKMGQDLADEYNCIYIEASAKTSYNIDNIFRVPMEKVLDNIAKGIITPADTDGIKEGFLETIPLINLPSDSDQRLCCKLL